MHNYYRIILKLKIKALSVSCPPCSPNLLSPNVVSPKKAWDRKLGETGSFLSPTTVLPNADSPNFPRLGKCINTIKQCIASW